MTGTQILTSALECPTKSFHCAFYPVFPSEIYSQKLGLRKISCCVLRFSFVVCLLQPLLLHFTGANPVRRTPKVIVYEVKPLLSRFMTAWFVVLSEQSFGA